MLWKLVGSLANQYKKVIELIALGLTDGTVLVEEE